MTIHKEYMMQQSFPAEGVRRIVISEVKGDLRVQVWDQPAIQVEAKRIAQMEPEGDVLMLNGSDSSLQLLVPRHVGLVATSVSGDVRIAGIQYVELTGVQGSADIADIADVVSLDKIKGDVRVRNCNGTASAADIKGDASFEEIRGEVSVISVAGDFSVRGAATLKGRGELKGDVSVIGVGVVDLERVKGDLILKDCSELTVLQVGGDLLAQDGIARDELARAGPPRPPAPWRLLLHSPGQCSPAAISMSNHLTSKYLRLR